MRVTQTHIDYIIARAKDYGATKIILFGSALETPENARDIDIAADVPGRIIDEFAGMVENELRCVIDAVPLADERHPFIRHILTYGKRIL